MRASRNSSAGTVSSSSRHRNFCNRRLARVSMRRGSSRNGGRLPQSMSWYMSARKASGRRPPAPIAGSARAPRPEYRLIDFDLVGSSPQEQQPEQGGIGPAALCRRKSQPVALNGPDDRLQCSPRVHHFSTIPVQRTTTVIPRSAASICPRSPYRLLGQFWAMRDGSGGSLA